MKTTNSIRFRTAALAALLAAAPAALAQNADQDAAPDVKEEKDAFAAKVEGLDRREGLLITHVDAKGGKLWLELPAPGVGGADGAIGSYIYVEGITTGLGSNPVGLDRGQIGGTKLINIRRVGPKVLFEQPNLRFRALSDNAKERAAVAQAFASSVVWAGDIAAEADDGRLLVDLTPFIVRDAHGVANTLRRSGQGSFSLDKSRSVLDAANSPAFPENLEFEAILTFQSNQPGALVRQTAPTAGSVTITQHHSIIKLPDDGYTPRKFDPRVSSSARTFSDYAAPLDEPLTKKWISRHRLEKTNPNAARSTVKEPIVYYVDAGAPEPVKSALVEGAGWWNEAFEAAGFIDAYRVEVAPPHVHPLDTRYNMIQWVHRSTRGWSYGGTVSDPRTGEIIKGHVSLGSLRVRQDRLIFEGLAGAGKTGTGEPDDPVVLSLARIRQLGAHEVGHTLGFAHNFAASTYLDRASVMDYPAPLVTVGDDGALDFSDVYGVGIGAWDKHAVRYAYSQFPAGADEDAELAKIVAEGLKESYLFISDSDSRPMGSAHPLSHLWDNGADPVASLEEAMRVRRVALDNFGPGNVRPGTPTALLHETFVPVYLHHRYQAEAAVKVVGGVEYIYSVIGDGHEGATAAASDWQRRALRALLRSIGVAELDIREETLALLMPRPFGYGGGAELFGSGTSPAFDAVGAAATAADMTIGALLNAQRANRLVDQRRRDAGALSLDEVLAALVAQSFDTPVNESQRRAALRRAVQGVVVARTIGLASSRAASPESKATVESALARLRDRLARIGERAADVNGAHAARLAREIARHFERPAAPAGALESPRTAPPGMPIGGSGGGGGAGYDLGSCSTDR